MCTGVMGLFTKFVTNCDASQKKGEKLPSRNQRTITWSNEHCHAVRKHGVSMHAIFCVDFKICYQNLMGCNHFIAAHGHPAWPKNLGPG
jgi:hypothetical protein